MKKEPVKNEPKPVEEEPMPQPMMPQGDFSLPPSQNLEVTKFLIENDSFLFDKVKGEDDEGNVIAGDVPPDMKNYFWAFFSKDSALTYLEDRDMYKIQEMFKAAKISYMNSLSPGKFDWRINRNLDELETQIYFRIRRSKLGFERKQETTQIQQTLYGEANGPDGMPQQKRSRNPLTMLFGGR